MTVAVHWLLQATADVPAGDDWLTPAERARLAGLRAPARRADWRLGRWTAKRAVAALLAGDGDGPGAAVEVEIRNAPDGAPEVLVEGRPAPLAISLPERAAVHAATAADRPLLVSLLWSAKESALKALRTGLRLDTRWVAVDPPAPAGPGRWHPLTVRHPATRRVFPGWWRLDDGRILTMVATPAPSAPRAVPVGPGPA